MKRYLKYAIEIFRKNKGMFLITIFIITISILLSISTYYTYNIALRLTSFLKSAQNISVLFAPETPESQIDSFIKELAKYPQVQDVYQKPPKEILGTYLPEDYPIPEDELVKIVRINLKEDIDPTPIVEIIRQERNANENIIEIIYLPEFYKKVIKLSSWINTVSIVSFILFSLLAFGLIYLTLELGLHRLKTEIHIMRNIGAGFNTIFIPLLMNTLFTVFIGGFLSMGGIYLFMVPIRHILYIDGSYPLIRNLLNNLGLLNIFKIWNVTFILFTIILGFAISTGLFTFIIVKRFLINFEKSKEHA